MRAGQAIITGVKELGLEVRIGIHVGECELHDRKPTGIAVNVAARVAQVARAGEVVVTRTARDLVAGADLSFTDRGEHELKGVPGSWKLYALGS
jgi:class 3 adenylate cyclase